MVPVIVLVVTLLAIEVHGDASPTMERFIEKFMETPGVPECLTTSGLKKEEMKKGPYAEMTPERLCFVKCVSELFGMLSQDGDLDLDESNLLPFVKNLPEDQRNNFVECAAGVGKIKSCDDMSKVVACFPKRSD